MPKRIRKKAVPKKAATKVDAQGETLRHALAKRTKDDLVNALMELAKADHRVRRQLDVRFEVEASLDELIAATRRAIGDATAFDERDADYNFNYDHAAYDEVKRNLIRLVAIGQLRPAMELALELMKAGSYQVEMSDEGLMTDEIEECLLVVVKALAKCDLTSGEILGWCATMTKRDRVGFICDDEIQSLQKRINAASS